MASCLERAYHVDMSRAAVARAVRGADAAPLDHRAAQPVEHTPATDADRLGLVDGGEKVLVTGRHDMGRAEIVVDGQAALGHRRLPRRLQAGRRRGRGAARSAGRGAPRPDRPGRRRLTAPCPDSSVESGLTSSAVMVYRAVCHAFPQITTYGGYDAHGEHASGRRSTS